MCLERKYHCSSLPSSAVFHMGSLKRCGLARTLYPPWAVAICFVFGFFWCKLRARKPCEWGMNLTSFSGCKLGQSVGYQLPGLCVKGLRTSQAAADGHSVGSSGEVGICSVIHWGWFLQPWSQWQCLKHSPDVESWVELMGFYSAPSFPESELN